MQAAFEESMLDATGENGHVPYEAPHLNTEQRSQLLCKNIEASDLEWNCSYNCHWRNFPKGRYHLILKTVSQIAFGVHLLHQHLEKSVSDVADILLKHVNEMDGFLQRANEDIEGCLKDMFFRRKCLKVPMEHVNTFDRLLEDPEYRRQLLDGNIVIERTIQRMSELLNDHIVDISTFRSANSQLDSYLRSIGDEWTKDNEDTERIYSAMCGNTAGWGQFLQSLIEKADKLGVVLVQVSTYCKEIQKRCDSVSRKSAIASRSSSRASNSRETSRSRRKLIDNKPLPKLPTENASPNADSFTDPVGNREAHMRARSRTRGNMPTITDSDSSDNLCQAQSTASPVESGAKPLHHHPIPRPGVSQVGHSTKSTDPSEASLSSGVGGDFEIIEKPDVSGRGPVDHTPTPYHQHDEDLTALPPMRDPIVGKPATIIRGHPEGSPLLTGNDSAYSSGGSFPSPTVLHPRSASSQSSYGRAQFGLFPSSVPGTPKPSLNGRHGALSPLSFAHSPHSSDQPNRPIPRSQSALDTHASSSRRLLKKSSFSSLKKLFGKKKQNIDAIPE
jgi:hypothetical protein